TNCVEGVQVCSGGHWSACGEGSLMGAHRRPDSVTMGDAPKPPVTMGDAPKPPVTMGDAPKPPAREHAAVPLGPAPSGSGYKLLSTSQGSCMDSCDPTCMQFTETSPGLTSVTYNAQACPAGTSVEWRWLAYDTTLPAGTTAQFFVQTPSM